MAPPLRVAAGAEAAALAEWVRVLEGMVRRAPEQWFNFFDVWSAAPAS
jgi:predicted LPLAT superfamily acyltransferase